MIELRNNICYFVTDYNFFHFFSYQIDNELKEKKKVLRDHMLIIL